MNSKSLVSSFKRSVVLGVSAAMVGAPIAANAQVVSSLSDLVSQPTYEVQRELRSRGYVLTNSNPRGSVSWQYWWNNQENMCVTATMRDGRSSSFVKSSPTDCNQPVNQSDKPGLSDGAKVAIGAAALLGIVALAHKSNDRNENQYNDERSVAEFERGYRDGMYHQGYHDYNRSQAYADGYNSGQQKRSSETSYRAPDGYHSGNASYFSVNDLVGSRATLVEGTMRDRGFKYATSSRSGSNTFTHWQNFQTRQCVEIVTANDEVLGVNNINFFSCR